MMSRQRPFQVALLRKEMVQDCITKAVLCRLRELDLPSSLIDLEEFRDHFLKDNWVMFVRDRDKVADVHLVQPPEKKGRRAQL